jgi:hypothetical protein
MSDDTVLKGGISNIRYIWHTNGDNPCELCEGLDGNEYNQPMIFLTNLIQIVTVILKKLQKMMMTMMKKCVMELKK